MRNNTLFSFTYEANEDLSSKQFHFVKYNANGRIDACDTAGERSLGILQNKPKKGEPGNVVLPPGQSKLICGAAVAFDNELATDGNGNSNTKINRLPRNHDSILTYSKHKITKYERQFKPYNEKTLKMYSFNDHDGRGLYRLAELRSYGKKTILKFKNENRIVQKPTGKSYLKQYLKSKPGVTIDSIWEDISGMRNKAANERVGYPTQKPLALLERIINTFSDKNDTVADFFCGSGTSMVAAKKLGRNYVGCDVNERAVKITQRRLNLSDRNS